MGTERTNNERGLPYLLRLSIIGAEKKHGFFFFLFKIIPCKNMQLTPCILVTQKFQLQPISFNFVSGSIFYRVDD